MIRTLALGINWWFLQVGIPLVLTHDSRFWLWATLAGAALVLGVVLKSSLLSHVAFIALSVAPMVRSPQLLQADVMPPWAFALACAALVAFLLFGVDAPMGRPIRRVLDAKWARRRRYFAALCVATFAIPAALFAPFVTSAPPASGRDTAAIALLAVFLVVILRELLLSAIEDHVAQDVATRGRLEAVRALDRRGAAMPRALLWIALGAIALIISSVATRS